MKTLRFVGVALLAVLMSVGFSACGGDDDDVDNGGSSASIEGTWYVKSMKGYHYYITNGEVVPHNSNKNPDEEYDDNSKSVVVKVSLKDGNIYWNADGKGYSKHTFIFEKMGGNEYICKRPKSEIYDRIVIKDVSKDLQRSIGDAALSLRPGDMENAAVDLPDAGKGDTKAKKINDAEMARLNEIMKQMKLNNI